MKKNMLLRTNLFVCIIIVFGFIITSLISYHSNRGIFRKSAESVSALTSDGIYHEIDSIFTKPINISLTMANDTLLKNFLWEEKIHEDDAAFIQTMRNYLLAYRDQYEYDSVFLVSARTRRYYHFNGLDRVLTSGNPENVWYDSFLNSPQEYSINIDNDEVTGKNNEITVFINCKIKDETGSVLGVVGVGFAVDYIQEIFSVYEKEYGVMAYLVDDNGIIQISTKQTGYHETDLFELGDYPELKQEALAVKDGERSFWYSAGGHRGYFVSQYVPNLNWHLIIENDTSAVERTLDQQFFIGVVVILLVIGAVLYTITNIIRKYNTEIVRLTVEKEKKHRSVFQTETEKIYENIYEVDVTHDRAAGEETDEYFVSMGAPKNAPFSEAIKIVAQKQIKEEFRQGYLTMFSPDNILKSYEAGIESLCYDFLITNDGGENYYWIRTTARIFFWDDDQSVRILVFRQDVDEEKSRERALMEMMERDSLTGLYNKAATQGYIRSRLTEQPEGLAAFFILDIDNFKRVNDTCGHAIGDMVIAEFAERLKSQFRSEDIVGRIGGDEFVVFLPVPSKEWAEKKAQNMAEVLRQEFVNESKRCSISASIGVAIAPEAGTEFETLYRNADIALYRTKARGKDGYTVF